MLAARVGFIEYGVSVKLFVEGPAERSRWVARVASDMRATAASGLMGPSNEVPTTRASGLKESTGM